MSYEIYALLSCSVFLDADKKQYKAYLQNMIGDESRKGILNDQALIIVDNTLWKGLVLNKVCTSANIAICVIITYYMNYLHII
ncbi:hypothetical protein EON65_09510 [archaeon]|nr:MAG: hypothetical protein EON65_09510 [archaeon]